MIPELGQLALAISLSLAFIQAIIPIAGAAYERADWMALARPTAIGQFVFVALSGVNNPLLSMSSFST